MIDKAVGVLRKGGVIIFPTDTVWGIGCSLDKPQAIKKLYQIKKRDQSKPTAVLIGSLDQAKKLASFTPQALKLAKKYWPGGLTIVIKAKKSVSQLIQGEKGTIGLRMPDNELLLKILRKLNSGVVASSANFSGQPIPKTMTQIDSSLIKLSDLLVTGKAGGSLASTVIDLTSKPPQILRQGILLEKKLLL